MKFSYQNDVKYNYKLFESQINQNQWCGAVAINQKNNFVLLDYNMLQEDSHLKMEFFIKQILSQTIRMMCLLFKYTNQIITYYIRIQQCKNCDCRYQFDGQSKDTLIAFIGYKDCTIKFWNISNYKLKNYCYQTFKAHKKPVLKLSMNKQGNQLLSLGIDKIILIMIQQESFWIIQQKILLDQEGPKVYFLTDEIFIFQLKYFFPINKKLQIFQSSCYINQKRIQLLVIDFQVALVHFLVFIMIQAHFLFFKMDVLLR
ncbi:unnamed protein product [Paramecium sonneborni]|uniref:Uncharacterized protein n=1 Tax=Paramecium sonneborni TaxID=65129 RepID=A0A8S1QNA6_9CILI|nr:unnamed protein product [Paramecium sonneborni]